MPVSTGLTGHSMAKTATPYSTIITIQPHRVRRNRVTWSPFSRRLAEAADPLDPVQRLLRHPLASPRQQSLPAKSICRGPQCVRPPGALDGIACSAAGPAASLLLQVTGGLAGCPH